MFEMTVTVKGEESTYKQKFLVYEEVTLKEDDPVLKDLISEALAMSKVTPDEVKLTIKMQVQ